MNNDKSTDSATAQVLGFSPWEKLKSKNISYLTLPLLVMATITEFVILATGWKYQQSVCVPKGMGVTFFGIGPIGATILAVELLKLPLAIWTASRSGWQKGAMLIVGLPLICLLTFQLVKDMAVYEMGVALTPASQLLEKAAAEEIKITQLNGELAAIEQKKDDRGQKLAEQAAMKAKAKTDLEEELKRNDESRKDAISLTDYQQKELSEVEVRQAAITRQFNNDTVALNKALDELRARREAEFPRATKWNAEEARIENEYKKKLADYTNKKATYEKDKAEYATANFFKRHLMGEPVDPGVAPDREVNTIVKPNLIGEVDAQIAKKEAELLTVNNKRRDRLAEVADDARKVREEFDQRSRTKRDETDRRRDELMAAQAALTADLKAQQKQMDQELAGAVQKVDGIRAELDASKKAAEGYYEAREVAIKSTQVHRIATTVEIVRGLFMGQRPISIKATSKERGDIYTDQISMVRIWVYPVLAFIVAFLPTLMVEVGFSTLFKPDQQRPAHRFGFLGLQLHALEKRAGQARISRAERLAKVAHAEIGVRNATLVTTKAEAAQALAAKEEELQTAHQTIIAESAKHVEQAQEKQGEWDLKLAEISETLYEITSERDNLLNFQQTEIERQVQLRQDEWSARVTQARQELAGERATNESDRATTAHLHQKKLLEVAEDWRTQLGQVRRQLAETEVSSDEKISKLTLELKDAFTARDAAHSQLQLQTETLNAKLALTKEDATRESEKAARQEKLALERQQFEFAKTLRKANDEADHRVKQREQEVSREFDTRLAQEQTKVEQDVRRREEEFKRQLETNTREVEARWNQITLQREDAMDARLTQQEQQLQAQADIRIRDAQAQVEEQTRRRETELAHQYDAQIREAEARWREELQQKELAFHAQLKQREQALNGKVVARENELQKQWAAELRTRQEEWDQQADSRVKATEARLAQETKQKDEVFSLKLRQREHQLEQEFNANQADLLTQHDQELQRRDAEMAEGKKREQALTSKLELQAEAHKLAEKDWATELETARGTIEPLKALLARTEAEVDLDWQAASEGMRQVQDLKKKLSEAASVLSTGKNGKKLVGNQG